jgi:hypothetical protein
MLHSDQNCFELLKRHSGLLLYKKWPFETCVFIAASHLTTEMPSFSADDKADDCFCISNAHFVINKIHVHEITEKIFAWFHVYSPNDGSPNNISPKMS